MKTPAIAIFIASCLVFLVSANHQNDVKKTIKTSDFKKIYSKYRGILRKAAHHDSGILSKQCEFDINLYLQSEEEWAARMSDAEGKPRSGMLDGRNQMIGSFDECRRVVAKAKYNETSNNEVITKLRTFNAKYCRSYWFDESEQLLSMGVCVPESCSRDDVNLMFVFGSESIPVFYSFCGTFLSEFSKDGSAIAASVVLGIFAALLFVSTAYHVIKTRLDKTKHKRAEVTINMGNVGATPGVATANGQNNAKYEVTRGSNNHVTQTNAVAIEQGQTRSKQTPSKPFWEKLLLCFSLKNNLPKMVSTYQPKGSYGCMNGVRFLSMLWIILHHTHNLGLTITMVPTIDNQYTFSRMMSPLTFVSVTNGQIAVESFFLLSSCLVAISFFKATERQGNKIKVRQMILFYVHRFFRLTPVYMLIIMMYACYFRYIPNGPLRPEYIPDAENCRKNWWTHLIYLNNFINTDDTCMGHSWYLADDMQFYVISPLFLIPLALVPVSGYVIVGTLFAAHMTIYGYMNWKSIVEDINFFQFIYTKPYCRIGPYLIGTILGYILFKTKCKVRMHKAVALVGWLVSFVLLFFTTYGTYFSYCEGCPRWNTATEVAFWTLMRSGFTLGLAWVVFACCTGYGGFINSLLSWSLFAPLSRLTFVGYLIHPLIMYYYNYTRYDLVYIQLLPWIYFFVGHTILSIAGAFVISLCLEVPFLELDKILLPRK